jgi:vesicle coat complex subunit
MMKQVHQFDIVLDVLLVNQTTETLQNLTVEFATLGDLKVVERPPTQNVGPHDFINIQATIKVSSTDTGVIFGNVIYEGYVRAHIPSSPHANVFTARKELTPTLSSSTTCTWTSWTTSSLPIAQRPSSEQCGPSSNGRTK